jgi:hypothetical protein
VVDAYYFYTSVLETSTATLFALSSIIRMSRRFEYTPCRVTIARTKHPDAAAVLRKFPESEFFAREIFPEEFGPKVFEPLGFKREPLNQILMRHDLKS